MALEVDQKQELTRIRIDNDKIQFISLMAKMHTETPMEALTLLILATRHFSNQFRQPHIKDDDQSGLIQLFTDVVNHAYQGRMDTEGTA